MNTSEMTKKTKFLLSDLIFQPPLRVDFSDEPQNNLARINRVLLRNKIARIVWWFFSTVFVVFLFLLTVFAFVSLNNNIVEQFVEDSVCLAIIWLCKPTKIHAAFLEGIENILFARDLFSATNILKQYWNAVIEAKRPIHELEIVAAQKLLEKRLSSQKIS